MYIITKYHNEKLFYWTGKDNLFSLKLEDAIHMDRDFAFDNCGDDCVISSFEAEFRYGDRVLIFLSNLPEDTPIMQYDGCYGTVVGECLGDDIAYKVMTDDGVISAFFDREVA